MIKTLDNPSFHFDLGCLLDNYYLHPFFINKEVLVQYKLIGYEHLDICATYKTHTEWYQLQTVESYVGGIPVRKWHLQLERAEQFEQLEIKDYSKDDDN